MKEAIDKINLYLVYLYIKTRCYVLRKNWSSEVQMELAKLVVGQHPNYKIIKENIKKNE